MPYRFVCKDGEEPSGQREETCKVCPDHLTRQKNTPKPAKVVSKRGSEIRARASFHGRCSTGSEARSEEHTSELQSHSDLVCRLLLEKKKQLQAGKSLCSQEQMTRRGEDVLSELLKSTAN